MVCQSAVVMMLFVVSLLHPSLFTHNRARISSSLTSSPLQSFFARHLYSLCHSRSKYYYIYGICCSHLGSVRWCVLCRPCVDIRVSSTKVARRVPMVVHLCGTWDILSITSCTCSRAAILCAGNLPPVLRWWVPAQHWIQPLAQLAGSAAWTGMSSGGTGPRYTFVACQAATTLT